MKRRFGFPLVFSLAVLVYFGPRLIATFVGRPSEVQVYERAAQVHEAEIQFTYHAQGEFASLECLLDSTTCLPEFDGPPFLDDTKAHDVPWGYTTELVVRLSGNVEDGEPRASFAYVARPEPWAFWLELAVSADPFGTYYVFVREGAGCVVSEKSLTVPSWPEDAWRQGACIIGYCMSCSDDCIPERF